MVSQRELKQERSIPVQSRVDVATLADMVVYFEANGVPIRTMSQLLSWSVELAHDIVGKNEVLPKVHESIAEAHRCLDERELYQPGMRRRGIQKIANAITLENLRYEGIEPRDYVPDKFSMVHNKHSVYAPDVDLPKERDGRVSPGLEEAFKKIEEEKAKELEVAKAKTKEQIENMEFDKDGVVILGKDEELNSPEQREKEEREYFAHRLEMQREMAEERGVVFNEDGAVREAAEAETVADEEVAEKKVIDAARKLTEGEKDLAWEKRVKREVEQLEELGKAHLVKPEESQMAEVSEKE